MVHTIEEALIAGGVNTINNQIGGQSNAQHLVDDMLGGVYSTCMDKTFTDMDNGFKSYTDLTQAQGHIRLKPSTKRKAKAFVQWEKDRCRLGLDPADTPFPVDQTEDLIRH